MSGFSTPESRIRRINESDARTDADYVLYWMIANRRVKSNFSLDRAIEWSAELDKPLLVFEPLRCDYRWASDRFHRFVIDGMRDNAETLDGSGVGYFPYVEPEVDAAEGLLAALAAKAAVVVTDDFPAFFLPRMVEAAGRRLDVRLEAVDSNGLLPLSAPGKAFSRAFDFRRYLQSELPPYLDELPEVEPLATAELAAFDALPAEIEDRWPAASSELLEGKEGLEALPIDHDVAPVEETGGARAAEKSLESFLSDGLDRYDEESNEPEAKAVSELSAYLHFGHLSAHQVFAAIASKEEWSPWKLQEDATGKRRGWWSMTPSSEAYLDQLVTWRELGYNFCRYRPDYAEYESLPDWSRETLHEHAGDERPETYTLEQFEKAKTHDELWNAAQNELRARGRIHNYLRMLWGKKILHWTRSPQEALDIMTELNNKYAIDGRNPNSYSGIFWVLGRFDRAWGPEREVFGKVRYMTSKNTRRKRKLDRYLERWSDEPQQLSL